MKISERFQMQRWSLNELEHIFSFTFGVTTGLPVGGVSRLSKQRVLGLVAWKTLSTFQKH